MVNFFRSKKQNKNRVVINGREFTGGDILIKNDSIYMDGKSVINIKDEKEIHIHAEDFEGNIESEHSIVVHGDVRGNATAGTFIVCEDIFEDANAGTSIDANDIYENAKSGMSINAKTIKGDAFAGISLNYYGK